MSLRPFMLLGERQLAWLGECADQRLAAWSREWLPSGLPAAQVVAAAEVAPPRGTWLSFGPATTRCHLLCEPAVVEHMLFGEAATKQPSALARRAAEAALADLARRCLPPEALPTAAGQEAAEPAAWRRGSGAIVLRVALPSAELVVLLESGVVRHWLAPMRRSRPGQPAPHELRTAVGAARLELGAWAGHAEIDIASLQALAVGDVIPLDLRIDQPLRLTVDGRQAVRGAFLGSREGHRTLRLTATAEFPESPDS